MRRLILTLTTALTGSLAIAATASAAEPLLTTRSGDVNVWPISEMEWCHNHGNFILDSADGHQRPNFYSRPSTRKTKIIQALGTIIEQKCPEMRSFCIRGAEPSSLGGFLYPGQGCASYANNWTPASASDALSGLPPEPATECDMLAAHPNDYGRPIGTSGVHDAEMNAGAAEAACFEALNADPLNPRLNFQVGRAFLKNGQFDDAFDFLNEAANLGHALSNAYLHQLAEKGIGIQRDRNFANQRYDLAARAGVTLSVNTVDIATARTIPLDGYMEPLIIDGAYNNNYSKPLQTLSSAYINLYIVYMAELFKGAAHLDQALCPGSFSEYEYEQMYQIVYDHNGIPRPDPQYTLRVMRQMLLAYRNGGLAGMEINAQNVMQDTQAFDNVWVAATEDAFLFIERHSCGTPEFNRLRERMYEIVTVLSQGR